MKMFQLRFQGNRDKFSL